MDGEASVAEGMPLSRSEWSLTTNLKIQNGRCLL